jgi:hypothetical protein
MKEGISILAFFLLIGTFAAIGIGSIKRKKECDTTVILTDGTILKATETVSYMNGMTSIISCEEEKTLIPTTRIKIIK